MIDFVIEVIQEFVNSKNEVTGSVANSRKYPSIISIPSIKRVYKNIDLDSDKYEL